jgi:hypothetical protein
MSVVAFRGRDRDSEARALLNCVLRDGDIVGTDDAGRTALLLVLDPWTLDRLLAFDGGSEDLEDADGEPEPDKEIDGPATVLDFVPPKRVERRFGIAQALALTLLLVTVSHLDARANEEPAITRPVSTSQVPRQCCRMCQKGQPCGDACISATRQCTKEQGCACSAASGS